MKLNFNKKLYYGIGLTALLLFLLLAFIIKSGYTTTPFAFDSEIDNFAYSLQSSSLLIAFFTALTNFFGDANFELTGIVMLILFFVFRKRLGAIWFGILAIASTVGNSIIKNFIGRLRPDGHRIAAFAHYGGMSFASGHSVFATIFLGCLFLIFSNRMKTQTSKWIFGLLSFFIVLLVMFSRVFVGVHYPSDTLGGLLEGIAILFLTYPIYFKYRVQKNSH
ncbi:phosphatase PAP2 family protein [Lactococcus nasutitermitis]|uniref:Phosphatase PAP2 family protein n=1 Tax=Lactococcus nasutitermitis TaxID=1652957 RepID=A0ABV9JHA1_9LACT|nr:phosphatase PAP2 family protein [Lactococcus nasutitermitis]